MMTALSPEELKRRARQLKRDVELGRPVPPVSATSLNILKLCAVNENQL